MNTNFLVQGVLIILIVSGLPLLLSGVCSIFIAFLQTITQIQEQSLSYIVKCIVVFATFYFCFNYFYTLVINYFNSAFVEIIKYGSLSI